jgi:hypothetical protein
MSEATSNQNTVTPPPTPAPTITITPAKPEGVSSTADQNAVPQAPITTIPLSPPQPELSELKQKMAVIENGLELEKKMQFLDGRVRGLTDSQRSINTLAHRWIGGVIALVVGFGYLQYLKNRDLEESTKKALVAEVSKNIKGEVEQQLKQQTTPAIYLLQAQNLTTTGHLDLLGGDFVNAAARLALAASIYINFGSDNMAFESAVSNFKAITGACLPRLNSVLLETPALAYRDAPLGKHLTNLMDIALSKDAIRYTNVVTEMKTALQAVYERK